MGTEGVSLVFPGFLPSVPDRFPGLVDLSFREEIVEYALFQRHGLGFFPIYDDDQLCHIQKNKPK